MIVGVAARQSCQVVLLLAIAIDGASCRRRVAARHEGVKVRDGTRTAAPIATGWSDSCRVGFAPTGRPCLCTAHRIYRASSKNPRILATARGYVRRSEIRERAHETLIGFEYRDQPLEHGWSPPVIGVEEREVVSRGEIESSPAALERPGRPAGRSTSRLTRASSSP